MNERVFTIILSKLEHLEQKVDEIAIEMATLKVKASIWGLLAGLIPSSLALSIYILTNIL